MEGKVFVDGIETNNAELIGYAILDLAENKHTNYKLKKMENLITGGILGSMCAIVATVVVSLIMNVYNRLNRGQ